MTIVSGLVGGLVATVVMTVSMLALGDDSPPPTARFWSRYVGGGPPGEYVIQGMVLHLVYGTLAGGVFAFVVPAFRFVDARTLASGVLWGLAYGIVLFVVAAVFWLNLVLDVDADPGTAVAMGFFHLVYGVVLGGWLGYGLLA